MAYQNDPLLSKVELIMESPTERRKYMDLKSFDEKISFIRDHFLLKEMEVKLLERRYLLDENGRYDLFREIDDIINRIT